MRRVAIAFAAGIALGVGLSVAVAQRRPVRAVLPPVPERPRAEVDRQVPVAEWPSIVGWPRGLASPSLEATHAGQVSVLRRRFADGADDLHVLGMGGLEPTWSRWIAAVRAAGGTVENERSGTQWRSATVCVSSCSPSTRHLAVATMDSWLRFHLRAAIARPIAPPGACVAVPSETWRICFTAGSTRTMCSFTYGTRWDVDIDRDGIADALVPRPAGRRPEMTCPNEVEWDVFVSRGSCGHHVGRIRGDVDRWHHASAETAHGLAILTTQIEPDGPWDSPITVRNAFDGVRYREVAQTTHRARCDYHPADCEHGGAPLQCAVRDHATLVPPYDAWEAGALIHRIAERAQSECSAGISPPVRCGVDLEIPQSGAPRVARIRECGRAERCVARVFRAARFPRHSSDDVGQIGISFQVPAP